MHLPAQLTFCNRYFIIIITQGKYKHFTISALGKQSKWFNCPIRDKGEDRKAVENKVRV